MQANITRPLGNLIWSIFWLPLYHTIPHCTFLLISIVPLCTLKYSYTDQHCSPLNDTVHGSEKHCTQLLNYRFEISFKIPMRYFLKSSIWYFERYLVWMQKFIDFLFIEIEPNITKRSILKKKISDWQYRRLVISTFKPFYQLKVYILYKDTVFLIWSLCKVKLKR